MLHVTLLIIVLLANIVLAVEDNLAYHKFANTDLRNDLLVRTGRSIVPKNPTVKPNENPNPGGNHKPTKKFEELQQKYQNLKILYQNLKSEGLVIVLFI